MLTSTGPFPPVHDKNDKKKKNKEIVMSFSYKSKFFPFIESTFTLR